jgi:hypothetical protein
MSYHSGRTATATINGNEPPVVSWRVNPTVGRQEFRNSKTGRFPMREATFFDISGSIAIDYDDAASPFAAPFNIVVGTIITNLKCYIYNSTSGPFWNIPSALVTSTPNEITVDGRNALSFDWEVNGSFQYPGGITPT